MNIVIVPQTRKRLKIKHKKSDIPADEFTTAHEWELVYKDEK